MALEKASPPGRGRKVAVGRGWLGIMDRLPRPLNGLIGDGCHVLGQSLRTFSGLAARESSNRSRISIILRPMGDLPLAVNVSVLSSSVLAEAL